MKKIFEEIQQLLRQKGVGFGMDAHKVTFKSEDDPGPSVEGYETGGVRETIYIPDDYMSRSGARDSREFLQWLKDN